MELLVVGWLLGLLSAAFGALVLHRLTVGANERALRRALVAEIRENMRRLGAPNPNRVPNAPVVRTAWDGARTLPVDDATFDAIARGYNLGEDVNYNVALITARATRGGLVRSAADELAAFERAQDEILGKAGDACEAFATALQLMGATAEGAA